MKIGLLTILPVLIVAMAVNTAQATDEQRRAYDEMVEQSVKEADDYLKQKQRQQAERYADEQKAEQRRIQEAAEMQKDEEAESYSRGVILIPPPAGRPPGQRPPGRPPGHRPKPTPLPSSN